MLYLNSLDQNLAIICLGRSALLFQFHARSQFHLQHCTFLGHLQAYLRTSQSNLLVIVFFSLQLTLQIFYLTGYRSIKSVHLFRYLLLNNLSDFLNISFTPSFSRGVFCLEITWSLQMDCVINQYLMFLYTIVFYHQH